MTLLAGRSGLRIPVGARDFSLLQNVQTVPRAPHPASHSVGTRVFPGGVERPGREVNLSTIPRAEVKYKWSYTSLPRMFFFHGVGRGCVGGEIIDFEHDGGTRCILIKLFFDGSYFALLSFQILGPAPLRL